MAYRRFIPACALLVAVLIGNAVAQSRQESGRMAESRSLKNEELKPNLPSPLPDADAARLQLEADADRKPAEVLYKNEPKPKAKNRNEGPFSR